MNTQSIVNLKNAKYVKNLKNLINLTFLNLFLLTNTTSCSSDSTSCPLSSSYQNIAGRSESYLYRICVPNTWRRKDPEPGESIIDTKKPLCEFFIENSKDDSIEISKVISDVISDKIPKNNATDNSIKNPNNLIRITIHNFPSQSIEDRIPALSQISRWQGQVNSKGTITPQSFSGYVGFLFEAEGVLAWALQLGPDQYRQLARQLTRELASTEMRADITIKITGPQNLINHHRDDLITFARSFELINEIPLP